MTPEFPNTPPELLERLRVAAKRRMTRQERQAQRVSFIFGQMNGELSKERIREILGLT